MLQTNVSTPTAADFARAVEQAKLAALYNFAYGLSHEINNPLANIATRAQTLLADEKNLERRRKLATIVQQAFRAHEMIADLMLFARPPALRRESTDVVKLVDTVLGELQAHASAHGIELLRTGDSGPVSINVDPSQIGVAIKAIVQNGLEAVKTGGRVEVAVRMLAEPFDRSYSLPSTQYIAPGTDCLRIDTAHPPSEISPTLPLAPLPTLPTSTPHLLITISDTGPGIPDHVRPHIFDPFYSGREAGRGLGLGLSKAWRIINLHSGEMHVESSPDGGAALTISMPLYDDLAG